MGDIFSMSLHSKKKKKSLFQLVFTWVTFPEVCVL